MKNIITRREFVHVAGMATMGAFTTAMAAMNVGCAKAVSNKAKELEDKFSTGSADVQKFTDSCGREVYLPAQIDKVSPSGAYAQILLATLCPKKLVSLTSSFSKAQMKYLNSGLADLPALGRFYGQSGGGDINFEGLIKLDPDVIIDVGESKPNIKEDMDSLQQKTGLPVIFVEGVTGTFAKAYETLGSVLQAETKASDLATYINDTYSFALTNQEKIASRNLRVIYATGERGYDVKIKGGLHGAVLDAVGVDNLAVIEDSNASEVSPEKMMEWNPDILLLSPEDGFFEEIYDDKVWAGISAVQKRQVYEVPAMPYEWLDRPPSIQQTLGVKWLGNLLAPDIYNFDMVEETRVFYSRFWGCEVASEEAKSLLARSTLL